METLENNKMLSSSSSSSSSPSSLPIDERTKQISEAFQLIVGVFKECITRIDDGSAKDVIDLFKGYVPDEKYATLKEEYNRERLEMENRQAVNQQMAEHSFENFLTSNVVAAKLTKMVARKIPSQVPPFLGLTGNQAASYATPAASRESAANNSGSHGGQKKRHHHEKDVFGMNWNSIIKMASTLSLDQVKSMLNMLVMVISHMPIPVILREFQKYRILISVFFDLITAIVKLDPRYLATSIVVSVLSVMSFMNKKDKNLNAALNVAKYFHGVGAKKKFALFRLSTLVLNLSYLFKIINPPPITPSDLYSLGKAYLTSKL
ncbi:hypothetical protein DFA_03418 [Cavenderia fasciculata]|uniref:Uncharacterized protein n=1 Tax=Cavenderia fasciculata TaxID=261658 RepID=F4PHI6_CACFS|nr:uncharacterized protein DFA_03418 [Cavenderia fasciculata]EGG25170.1 hypothetical protein DFA_03418 [Cavenderia fasciculata]|eukprot:XP_004363021.1 hypothetical protein DFA_03418 [Cavenderia fasciculata]